MQRFVDGLAFPSSCHLLSSRAGEYREPCRKQVEEAFGWMKTIGGLRKTRYRGRERVQLHAYLVAAAYNLVRIARLAPVTT